MLPLTFIVLAILTGVLIFVRLRWPLPLPKDTQSYIVCACAALFLYALTAVTGWSTSSNHLTPRSTGSPWRVMSSSSCCSRFCVPDGSPPSLRSSFASRSFGQSLSSPYGHLRHRTAHHRLDWPQSHQRSCAVGGGNRGQRPVSTSPFTPTHPGRTYFADGGRPRTTSASSATPPGRRPLFSRITSMSSCPAPQPRTSNRTLPETL